MEWMGWADQFSDGFWGRKSSSERASEAGGGGANTVQLAGGAISWPPLSRLSHWAWCADEILPPDRMTTLAGHWQDTGSHKARIYKHLEGLSSTPLVGRVTSSNHRHWELPSAFPHRRHSFFSFSSIFSFFRIHVSMPSVWKTAPFFLSYRYLYILFYSFWNACHWGWERWCQTVSPVSDVQEAILWNISRFSIFWSIRSVSADAFNKVQIEWLMKISRNYYRGAPNWSVAGCRRQRHLLAAAGTSFNEAPGHLRHTAINWWLSPWNGEWWKKNLWDGDSRNNTLHKYHIK